MSFNKDLEHIGDSQQKDWRPFDKRHFTDGINDFGYWQNINSVWNGQPISDFFNIDKAFSCSFWCKATFVFGTTSFGVAAPIYSKNNINDNILIAQNAVRFGENENWIKFTPLNMANIDIFFCCTYDGSLSPNGLKLYINSIDLDSIGQTQVQNYSSPVVRPITQTWYQRQPSNPVSYDTADICDLRFFNNQILTSEEVRKLYHGNWETNLGGRTELIRLPMTLTSHYANNTPAGLCSALDISGNNNHLTISGQGTTPTLNNFY